MPKSIREIVEWALSMDGDKPPATPDELARAVYRRVTLEDAKRDEGRAEPGGET